MKNLYAIACFFLLSIPLSGQSNTLRKSIRTFADTTFFNGNILIQKQGKIIFHESFGLSNRTHNVKNTVETPFKIASITKAFTSVLVMKAYENGLIELDKPIRNYYPEYTGEGAGKVTIHHLLTHTSGIENCESKGTAIYELPLTVDEVILRYCSGKLENEPGSQFSYNNGDYIILGKILEKVYKKPYNTLLREQILQPLNMTHTALYHQPTVVPLLADTYIWNYSTRQFEHDAPFYLENYSAAGALVSTTGDLALFAQALFHQQLLKAPTLSLMTAPYPQYWNTAYGVWTTGQNIRGIPTTVVERYGSIQGANTLLAHCMERDITVILCSNTNATDLGALKTVILEGVIR